MEAHNIKFDDDRTLPPYNQTFSLFFYFISCSSSAVSRSPQRRRRVEREKKKTFSKRGQHGFKQNARIQALRRKTPSVRRNPFMLFYLAGKINSH